MLSTRGTGPVTSARGRDQRPPSSRAVVEHHEEHGGEGVRGPTPVMYNVPVTPREERALKRAQWTARLVTGSDPGEEGRLELSPEEAWLAVGRLTRALWSLTGRRDVVAIPRGQWPVRLFERGEVRDDGGEPR